MQIPVRRFPPSDRKIVFQSEMPYLYTDKSQFFNYETKYRTKEDCKVNRILCHRSHYYCTSSQIPVWQTFYLERYSYLIGRNTFG